MACLVYTIFSGNKVIFPRICFNQSSHTESASYVLASQYGDIALAFLASSSSL